MIKKKSLSTTGMYRLIAVTIAAGLAIASSYEMHGQISYSIPGSLYSENFDSLPADAPNNASIETVYTDGWRDNTTTTAPTHVSVPGWYLYHPISPASENGFNGNQRLRFGPGANTGAFWAFRTTTEEEALGSIGSTTVAGNGTNMNMALRLVNNTGLTLDGFTLTYDGEQWRDGQSPSGETLLFDYSLTATESDWFSAATFTAVPALNFTSPVVAGISSGGTAVDGNTAGKQADITATVSGISLAPGGELWLRWSDPQLANNADDGLAVDNVRFTAVPEPSGLILLASGLIALLAFRRRQ